MTESKESSEEKDSKETIKKHVSEKTSDKKSAKKQKAEKSSTESNKVDKQIADLKKQIADLQDQLDSVNDKYLRAEAEMQNVQNHAKKEQAQLLKYDGQQIAHDVLPIVDNLKRALDVKVEDKNGMQLKKGVSMTLDRLNKALKENGVELIEVNNKPFDPNFAQAVQTVAADDNHPADTVVQVLQEGYRLRDRVLRPAMVVVAK